MKGIDESARSTEDLDTAMQTLQQVKTRYMKVIDELHQLFLQDKRDESKEAKETLETVSVKYLDIVESKIQEISCRLELSHWQHEQSRSAKALSKESVRSARTRVSKASSSVERQRAIVEVAAAQKQVEYDILIAKKEKERRELEAEEERKRVEAKAQYDHEIAVLKARMKAATAEAKLNAIERFVDVGETEFDSDRSTHDKMIVDKDGKSEAQSLESRYYTRSWIISQQSNPKEPLHVHNTTLNRNRVSGGARDFQPPPGKDSNEGDLATINKRA